MKQKKRKRIKTTLDFYNINAGFREPYKIILDGNFLHIALTSGAEDLWAQTSNLFGSSPKKAPQLYMSECVCKELQTMGLKETWQWAMDNVRPLECHHEGIYSPDACIKSSVGSHSRFGYFVATQDNSLVEQLGEKINVGFIQFSVSGMHLLPPSKTQSRLASEAVTNDMKPGEQELRSEALQSLKEEEKPNYKNNFQAKQIKKHRGLENAAMQKRPPGEKKKRPGPRLRNALKAQKLAETKDRIPDAKSMDSEINEQNVGPNSDARLEEHSTNDEAAQKKRNKPSDKSKGDNDDVKENGNGEKSHRKRKRRRSVKTNLLDE